MLLASIKHKNRMIKFVTFEQVKSHILWPELAVLKEIKKFDEIL
jgi:hypothetical protein